MTISRVNIEGFSGIIASNISDPDFAKLKNAFSGDTTNAPSAAPSEAPSGSPTASTSGIVSVKDVGAFQGKRSVQITTNGLKDYSLSPDGPWNLFSGIVNVYLYSNWNIYLRFLDGKQSIVNVVTKGENEKAVFRLSENSIIVESPITQPDSTAPSAAPQAQNPVVNGSEGNFDPSGNSPEMFSIGETYAVPAGRTKIQLSAFSMNHGARGLDCYVKQNGVITTRINVKDGDTSLGYFNNNHGYMTEIVIKEGPVEIGYRNEPSEPYHIVLGIAKIENNIAYLFYYADGLVKQNPLFVKQLTKGEHYVSKFDVVADHDYGYVTEMNPGSLHKDFTLNYFKDGKPFFGEIEWNGGGDVFYDNNAPLQANNSQGIYRKFRSKKDHSLFVEVQMTTGGYGQTGTIKLLNSNGLSISKDLCRISSYVFNFGWIDDNGKQQFNIREGLKEKSYKLYNNGGKISPDGKSIIQEQDL